MYLRGHKPPIKEYKEVGLYLLLIHLPCTLHQVKKFKEYKGVGLYLSLIHLHPQTPHLKTTRLNPQSPQKRFQWQMGRMKVSQIGAHHPAVAVAVAVAVASISAATVPLVSPASIVPAPPA